MVIIWLLLMVIVSLMMVNNHLIFGIPTPLKKYEFVSWDDEIPNIWKNKSHVAKQTNQSWLEILFSK